MENLPFRKQAHYINRKQTCELCTIGSLKPERKIFTGFLVVALIWICVADNHKIEQS